MKYKILSVTLTTILSLNFASLTVPPEPTEDAVVEPIVYSEELIQCAAAPVEAEPDWLMDVPLDESLQEHIWTRCNEYNITEHYELVYAVMKVESNYTVDIVSSTNDYGLMQINAINHEWLSNKLGIVDFLDPYQNVDAGIYLLQDLLHKYDTVPAALMCYNLGEGGAAKRWRDGVYSTTYTDKVLDYYYQIIGNI